MVSLAVLFAVCSAFGIRQTSYQFEFIGASSDWQDRVDEDMYVKRNTNCTGTELKLCRIVAPDVNSDNKPDIGTSGSLYDALENNQLASPDFSVSGVDGKAN